jgi:hypothetical protein
MKYTYTKAYSQYGASMGRRDNITESACTIKFHLQRVPLDSGGYDPGGAYWGLGCGWLYYAHGDGAEEVQEMFFRAHNRDDAKTQVRAAFPNCTFYR